MRFPIVKAPNDPNGHCFPEKKVGENLQNRAVYVVENGSRRVYKQSRSRWKRGGARLRGVEGP